MWHANKKQNHDQIPRIKIDNRKRHIGDIELSDMDFKISVMNMFRKLYDKMENLS